VRPAGIASVTRNRRRQAGHAARAAAVALVATCALFALAAGTRIWPGLETPALAATQPSPGAAPAVEHAAGGEAEASHEAAHEGSSLVTIAARLFNFAILAGTLIYFLRSPFMKFLAARHAEIRAALVKAAELRMKSARQLADLEQRVAALPGEIEALRARGTADVAAEEARIAAAAEADRARLTEQARRQIDFQLRVAKRELVAHAADLAVTLATERIRRTIRDEDQRRLVETYLSRVRTAPAAGVAPSAAPGMGGQP
jgi:F-type H+-transporting ATPase subunit b